MLDVVGGRWRCPINWTTTLGDCYDWLRLFEDLVKVNVLICGGSRMQLYCQYVG